MTKKIVLFASLCLFALNLSTASAEVIPAEYQAKGLEVVAMLQESVVVQPTRYEAKGKDILIMPNKSIKSIPVPAEFETIVPCPSGCHGGSGK